MRLLFVCFAHYKDGMLRCPSWVKSIISYISEDYEIFVLGHDTANSCNAKAVSGDRTVEFRAFDYSRPESELKKLHESISADICVIFGTETPFTLMTLSVCRELGMLDRTAVSAQGISIACAEHYADGVPENVINRYTFRDRLRRINIAGERKNMYELAKKEEAAVKLTKHFIGRTSLDRSILEKYNPSAKYYKCKDVLRPCFYSGQWSFDSCEKHRILISQFYYPLKGFHYILEAAANLKEKYPDMVIAAAGYNPINKSITKNEIKDSSYIRYIKSLVRKYGLEKHIELLGLLDEEDMKKEYLRANVFVLPSSIENSPNSLAEAMILGVPCVSSDVGGVPDYTTNETDAYVFPSGDVKLLEEYIDRVFSNPKAAAKMAENGKKRAEKDYDIARNIADFEAVIKILSPAENQ